MLARTMRVICARSPRTSVSTGRTRAGAILARPARGSIMLDGGSTGHQYARTRISTVPHTNSGSETATSVTRLVAWSRTRARRTRREDAQGDRQRHRHGQGEAGEQRRLAQPVEDQRAAPAPCRAARCPSHRAASRSPSRRSAAARAGSRPSLLAEGGEILRAWTRSPGSSWPRRRAGPGRRRRSRPTPPPARGPAAGPVASGSGRGACQASPVAVHAPERAGPLASPDGPAVTDERAPGIGLSPPGTSSGSRSSAVDGRRSPSRCSAWPSRSSCGTRRPCGPRRG